MIAAQLLLPLLIAFSVWTLFGYQAFRAFLFPIMLIVCAIPVWEVINEGWLQKITAASVSGMLEIVGISNYRENVQIYIPVGTFRVAENCSGMRQLVAAITIAVIYAYINHFRLIGMLAYTITAIFLSVIINMIRIFIVVVSGQLTNMQHYFVQKDHVTLGWVLFGIGIFIFIYLSNKIFSAETEEHTKSSAEPGFEVVKPQASAVFKAVMLIVIGLSVGPVLAKVYISETVDNTVEYLLPDRVEDWKISPTAKYDYAPYFLAANKQYSAIYTKGDKEVYCHISYYAKQEQGNELISTLNKIADEKRWITKSRKKHEFDINSDKFIVDEVVVSSLSGQQKQIWHWYYVGGQRTSSSFAAKLFGIGGTLMGRPESATIVLATDIGTDGRKAGLVLETFASETLLGLERSLEGAAALNE